MTRPRLLILGSGFAAFSLLRRIDVRAYDVTVVSSRNHFLFTPLLPSTTVGTVEFRTILEPVRGRRGVTFHLGSAERLDLDRRVAVCRSADGDLVWEQPYDVLAVGVGCVTATYGVPGVAEHACFLKEIEDARRLRQRLVGNLERACLPGVGDDERSRLLHFVAVGAGPTGVRFAAELYDLLVTDLPRRYPGLAEKVRVTVLDAGPSILGTYDQQLRDYVTGVFRTRGVTIRTQAQVKAMDAHAVHLADGSSLPCGLVLWCAGFAANPLIAGVQADRARGRLLTDDHLQLLGRPDVYALGDCAVPRDQELPQLAQVAAQQGAYLGDCLNRRARGRPAAAFRWRPHGISSYIGQGAAVVDSADHKTRASGQWAYQQWRTSLWSDLMSWRTRVLVPLDRLRAYVYGRDITRL